jgi:hypothetical protein
MVRFKVTAFARPGRGTSISFGRPQPGEYDSAGGFMPNIITDPSGCSQNHRILVAGWFWWGPCDLSHMSIGLERQISEKSSDFWNLSGAYELPYKRLSSPSDLTRERDHGPSHA